MTVHNNILRIAVPSPLYRSFDYLLPTGVEPHALQAGVRVRVPFGRRTVIGVLLDITTESAVAIDKLKPALAVLDSEPVLNSDILSMVQWASDYYHHPIGDALTAALPVLLRRGEAPEAGGIPAWRLTAAGRKIDSATLARAPRQQTVIATLHGQPPGVARNTLDTSATVLRTLAEKGWIESFHLTPGSDIGTTTPSPHTLNPAQQHAVDAIHKQYG